MKRVCLTTCLLIAVLVSGCANYWYAEDKSFCQAKDDCVECRIEARDYDTSANPLSWSALKYERKCMKKKGYKLVGEIFLPKDINKREPDLVYGEKYGVAGCLENDIH